MSRIAGAVLVALIAVLAITTVAYAAPPRPPYTLGQEVVTQTVALNVSQATHIIVTCPGSKVIVSGGYYVSNPAPTVPVYGTYPISSNGWNVIFGPAATEGETGQIFGICVNP